MKKSKFPIGTIRTFGGRQYIKSESGEWKYHGKEVTLDKYLGQTIDIFNKKISREVKERRKEGDDDREINRHVAHQFLYHLVDKYKLGHPQEIYWKNESKKPENHFQLEMETDKGILWATFVMVRDGKVVDDCDIQLLDSDYELIHKFHKGND